MAFKWRRITGTLAGPGLPPAVPPLTITQSTAFSDGNVNNAYSTTIGCTGGVTPYSSWTVVGGALPAGLSLSTAGAISGTPSTVENSTFTIQVRDSTGTTASQSFALAIASSGAPAPLSITTSSGLNQGVVNTAYSLTFQSTGGVSPYRNYVRVGGSLPAGLSLSSATGALTGTPSTTGTSTFTVEVTDAAESVAGKEFRCAVISSAVSTALHAYYETLRALPEHSTSYSLRTQSQLNGLTNAGVSTAFTYVWPDDGYTDPQDGAKLVMAVRDVVGEQQLHIPLGTMSTGRFLVTWDFFYGPEFRDNGATIQQWKTFNLRHDGGIWHTHVNRVAGNTTPNVCRTYDSLNASGNIDQTTNQVNPNYPEGVFDREPIQPWGPIQTPTVASDAGNGATTFKTTLTSSTSNEYAGWYCKVVSGSLNGQASKIASYDSTTKQITLSTGLTATPANGVSLQVVYAWGTTAPSAASNFKIIQNKWTRYWIECRPNTPAASPYWDQWKSINAACSSLQGTYHGLSLWIADEDRDPVRIISKVPWIRRANNVFELNYEFDTSATTNVTGPVTGYSRNVVMLRDYEYSGDTNAPESDATIFVKPVG